VRIWDTATGKEILVLARHPSAVVSVAFRPDGKALVVGCGDGTARVWNLHDLRER